MVAGVAAGEVGIATAVYAMLVIAMRRIAKSFTVFCLCRLQIIEPQSLICCGVVRLLKQVQTYEYRFYKKTDNNYVSCYQRGFLKDVETSNLLIVKLVYLSMNATPILRYRRKHR